MPLPPGMICRKVGRDPKHTWCWIPKSRGEFGGEETHDPVKHTTNGGGHRGWEKVENSYLKGHASGKAVYYDNLSKAKIECNKNPNCKGVVQHRGQARIDGKYSLRKGKSVQKSPTGETLYKKR